MRRKGDFDPRKLMEQAVEVMRQSVDEPRGDGKALARPSPWDLPEPAGMWRRLSGGPTTRPYEGRADQQRTDCGHLAGL